VRLVTTDGSDSDFAPGSEHVQSIMEHLAVVGPTGEAPLQEALEVLGRRASGGALVVVVAEVGVDDLRLLSSLRARYGSVTVVHLDRSAWDPRVPVGPPVDASVLRVTRDAPFAPTWNAHARLAASGRARVGLRR
jgi:hypothetical protein